MRRRVLLIEDEPNIVEAVRFILSRDGWDVDTHADGTTAAEAIRERSPDIVVLDAMLPGRSGYDVLRDVRQDITPDALPILMLTARGQDKDRDMALQAGANQFMTKPFANDAVLAAVRGLAEE